MGFEPTTLRDLVGCSNHRATGDSMASKGEMWVFDWNRITRSHSQICHGAYELTNCITHHTRTPMTNSSLSYSIVKIQEITDYANPETAKNTTCHKMTQCETLLKSKEVN